MEDLFSDLNPSQQEAVRNVDGPCLVIAGAGSGKTRVLTYRIAYLLSLGVPAGNILALTFTNKAAAEMKDRVVRIVGPAVAGGLHMGTFHSIFAKILRMEAVSLPGYDSNYTILDTDDVKKMLTQIVSNLNLDKDTYKASKVAPIISKAKNDMITADMYEASDLWKQDRINNMPAVGEIYKTYVSLCRKSNSMDFDDLLLFTNLLFQKNQEVLKKYQSIFRYILVDEYQDTNSCQFQIIKKLSLPENNLCVVGDDAQSIYSFRGARIENILNFSRIYKDYRLFKLERNYRSTKTIVEAANSLILKNKRQIPKNTYSELEEGEKIHLMECATDMEEGQKVADAIAEKVDEGENYSDFAILYRTNAQSRILEEALNRRRIPCKIVKGMSFFQRKEIKDILAYARVIINPQDEIALTRIVNYPARGIGNTTMEKVAAIATTNSVPQWVVLSQIEKTGSIFSAATKQKITEFVALIQSFMDDEPTADAYSLLNRIVEKISINEAIRKDHDKDEANDKINNVNELLNGAKEFVENEMDPDSIALHNYMEKIALMTDLDEDEVENPNKVLLMTVHAAKGLEFKHCFLVGIEEDIFPSAMSVQSQSAVEEERRLCYVAMTRAMRTLTMSYANSRRKYGNFASNPPSRFLAEIDSKYVDGSVKRISSPFGNTSTFNSFRQSQANPSFKQRFASVSEQKIQFNSSHIQPAREGIRSSINATKSAFSGYSSEKEKPFASYNKPKAQPTLSAPADMSEIQEGKRVFHGKFGFGVVKERTGEDANASAIISFENWGDKKLLLKFAKLQLVEN